MSRAGQRDARVQAAVGLVQVLGAVGADARRTTVATDHRHIDGFGVGDGDQSREPGSRAMAQHRPGSASKHGRRLERERNLQCRPEEIDAAMHPAQAAGRDAVPDRIGTQSGRQ